MKTVFDQSMTAHVWAQQTQEHGRSSHGNLYFNGATIYSYGSHFPIARFVEHKGRKAVLFTTRGYSSTTSGHKSLAASACRQFPTFHVEEPTRDPDTKAFRAEFTKRLDEAYLSAARARGRNAEWKLDAAERLRAEANECAEFFGWRWRLNAPGDFDAIKERAKAQQVKQAAATRKAEATRRRKEAERKAQWLAGEDVYWSDHSGDIVMRIHGEDIETSRGARFPVEHGKRAFRLILACKTKGVGWARNGHTIRLGHFQLDAIEPNGDVRAGCHFVRWAEIERIAGELGLLGENAEANCA